MELTLSGRYTSASFTPAGETAFSPDCRLTVQGEDTLVTFYITSVSPLNNEHDLPLGTLALDESFSLPSQAVVTLLDRELKAFPGLQRSTLSTRAATLSAPTGSGSSGGSSVRVRRKVIIRDSDHGRVRTDMGQARSGDTVTLTVEPEEGENPTVHFATDPGTVAPDDEDLEAIEPYYDGGVSDLPQQKLPGKVESAHHDLLPVE